MSKHGRDIACGGCGGRFPVTRESLKASKGPGGYRCKRCRSGRTRTRQRPTRTA